MHELARQLVQAVMGLPTWVGVAILSAAPVSEFRGGVAYGLLMHMNIAVVLPLSIVCALLPGIPIYFFFNWAAKSLAEKPGNSWTHRALEHFRHKSKWVNNWGALGLVIFAGLPLPGFGVYTGAGIAAVVGMPFRRALGCMALGVTLGAIVMAGLTLGGVQVFSALQGLGAR